MSTDQWVRLAYPKQFQLGLLELAAKCGWKTRQNADHISVCLQERYGRRRPHLVRLTRLADATNARDPAPYRHFVDTWQAQDSIRNVTDASGDSSPLHEALQADSTEDAWVAFRLRFMTLPDRELPAFVQAEFRSIVQNFPGASLWAIDFDERLTWRIATARTLFAASADPAFLARPRQGSLLFPAALGFMRSLMYGMAAYTEPILLVAAPWLLGMSSYRLGGSVVVLFGDAQPGFRPVQAPELLQILRPNAFLNAARPAFRPDVAPIQAASALEWWVARLDDLFGAALDPARFRTPDGQHDPTANIGLLLSLERLFPSVQAILAHAPRDPFVRAVLLFDVLDVLEGLGFDSWESLVSLAKVRKQLDGLSSRLPEPACELLLTRCRPAADALARVVDGFGPRLNAQGLLEVPGKSGTTVALSPERAAAAFLRLTRNAAHSYRDRVRDARDVALLTAYDGELPDELSDLALLHLLRFLDTPRLPT